MTNSSGRFLRGLMLGGTFIGLGMYLSKNKQLTDQISTKVKDALNVLSENTHGVQDKVMQVVDGTKSNLSHVVEDSKSSLAESYDKTSKQVNQTVNRLVTAFNAGRAAAKDSLKSPSTMEHGTDLSHSGTNKINTVTNPVNQSTVSTLGATEDTSVHNSSTLHPSSNNVGKSVGDASSHLDETSSRKIRSSVKSSGLNNDINDKFSGI